jgi:N-acetylglucosaminyldiphosphoundecaprenol N-acetyl-beta-D-mannosaminyltransferase
MKTVYVWGIKIDITTINNVLDLVDKNIKSGKKCLHITGVNAETIADIYNKTSNPIAINSSDIVTIDGAPILIALRLYGYSVQCRVTCPDLFEALMDKANTEMQSVYFFGAQESVLLNLVKNIKTKYPRINIVGFHNGFNYNEELLVNEISSLSPTYLFLGIPSMARDQFLLKYKHLLNASLCLGIGGMFDVLGGKIKRAPKFFQKIGLESIFRIIQKPSNYGIRFVKKFPIFIFMFFQGLKYNSATD